MHLTNRICARARVLTICIYSPDHTEPLELTFTGLNFIPLQTVSDRASEIISQFESKLALEHASLPVGVKEQYEYQLKMLKDPSIPDIEIMIAPFGFSPTRKHPPVIACASQY